MTAKEKLMERVRNPSEAEADETRRLLDMRSDPVVVAFCDAPDDDEPWTAEDAAATEADAGFAAGRTASLLAGGSTTVRITCSPGKTPPAGFEPATVGLEVQPEGVYQAESGLIEPITPKEFG
jgi:hypothetical protein